MKKYSHIIWDWNGTLLDDVDRCVGVINRMLSSRGLKVFANIAEYHEVFSFPVIDYYEKIGFDFEKEPFEELAVEYISLYHSQSCKLHKNARTVLREIQRKGIPQIILSASEINNLKSQLADTDITDCFDEILGISDIYAGSKTDIGLDFMKRSKVKKAILIGDTEHDYQTARTLGTDCVLIANGHQSRGRLSKLGVPVLTDIIEVLDYL
ncbi:MAG: HAD hydrolase-like protein [Oscillospiraceae bacterium]|nr:HAD hydrolase-like protein [Oscillospiraceae bacterium]